MRAPWTVLRDVNAEIRRERDERAELIALRKERIVLRSTVVAGYGGLILVIGWGTTGVAPPPGSDVRPTLAVVGVMIAALLAGSIGRFVAYARHGDAYTPEAKRAEATRSLLQLPLLVPFAAVLVWYVSRDVPYTAAWTITLAVVMTVALLIRRWLFAGEARQLAERDAATPADDA